VASTDDKIWVRSIEFGHPPFRKLSNIRIPISARLTLIAGHNGIGKSTILGLLSNTFGLTDGPKSYFGDPFFANIEKIVYLALDEVERAQRQESFPPIVEAQVGDVVVRKRCAMTRREKWNRARVVPRTVDKADDDPVGPDAKVPLPTIYLGIRRLASIGEADENEVASIVSDMDVADRQLMADFVKSIIVGAKVTTDVTHQSIKGSKKRTAQPGYPTHNALAISMGQDSLGSIATALASFNRLKREQGDAYKGGLLVIDELDVGFHPHAIERLATSLKTQAKRLDLQVIATTHSPRLIEAVHPDGGGDLRAPDSVIYLLDTQSPRIAPDQSLQAILDDMALRQDLTAPVSKPVLGVYFEDEEGKQFFDALIPLGKRRALNRKYNVCIKPIALSVGGSNLINLPNQDPLFKSRVLIVDGDTSIPAKAAKRGNALKFPTKKGATGTDRSPENTIRKFIGSMISAQEGELREALHRLNVTNPSSDKALNTFFIDDSGDSLSRTASKAWWNNHWKQLKAWKILEEWIRCNPKEVGTFLEAFEKAVAATAPRLR